MGRDKARDGGKDGGKDGGAIDITKALARAGVLPTIEARNAELALTQAAILEAAGLPVLEIAMRGPNDIAALQAVVQELPEALIGAGQVTQPALIREAAAAGAGFATSPGFTPGLLKAAQEVSMVLVPGVATLSEAMKALELGFALVQLFPAAQLGGSALLRRFAPLLPGMGFLPNGGLAERDMADYLALDQVVCVGGNWLFPRPVIEAEDWGLMRELARRSVAQVRTLRP